MLRRRPDLIVPIRDRRQRRRYLTLKNFGWATLAAIVAFVAISIHSEMSGRTPGGYGRLFRKAVAVDVQQKPVEIVREAPPPVDDATHADPMLVAPAARAQWLEAEAATTTTVAPLTTPAVTQGQGDATIVGGPDGVTIVRKERRKPVLSGGFGRE